MLSITFATAKVQQILHICKRSGIFLKKNATYRVLLGYRTVIGSLLTDNCSIPNKQGPKSHFQKKYPALYIFRKMRTYFRGDPAIFNSREDRSTTFSDICKLFFAFCQKTPKMIKKGESNLPPLYDYYWTR